MRLGSLINQKKRAAVKAALASGNLDKLWKKKKTEPETTQGAAPVKKQLTLDDQKKLKEELLEAVKKGETQIVKELLEKGTDVNARYDGGVTALMEAAWCGRTEIAEMLISKGADVNAKENTGLTALSYAAAEQRTETAEMLKMHGAKRGCDLA